MKRFNKLLCFMVVFITVIAAFCTVSFAANSQYTENLIPVMTSNTSPSGIASASGVTNEYLPYKAFDGKVTNLDCWYSNKNTGWLAYEFLEPQIVSKYTITGLYTNAHANLYAPVSWTFEAWDGNVWKVLDTRSGITGWQDNVKKEFFFENSIAYKKYRINVSKISGPYEQVMIGEMEMMALKAAIPAAPTNLSATPGNAKVDLAWDTVEGATSYSIKRSTIQGQETFLTSIPATTTSGAITYSDTGLQNGTTYYYVVSAVNAGGESPNSNEASATPQATNKLKLVLEVNQEKQLSVSEELSDNAEMDWISSDPSIATVDANGKVKALKPGNTVITCISKDKSYTESINVLVVDLVNQLAVDLNVGGTCRLTIDDLKNTTLVTWTSYDPTIATVSAKGKVTAVNEGLTYIIASDKDGKEIGRIYIRVRQ